MSLGASFPGGNNTPGHGRAWARARRSGLGLTPHPQFPKPYVAALGAVGSASLPTAQIPLLDVMLGQEEEVAGQAWWWVLGLRRGSSRGWWGRRQRSVPLPTPREGCGGPWVGIVLVKVGQVPALCSAGAGASLCVWGGQCGKGAVQFHFLHLLFTHRLAWGTVVHSGCPFGACPGLRTV